MTAQHLNNATTTPDFFREFQKVVYKIKYLVIFFENCIKSQDISSTYYYKFVGKQM